MGKIPGRMGHVMPFALQSSRNLRKVSTLKNSCVMTKSAPASTFSFRCRRSSS